MKPGKKGVHPPLPLLRDYRSGSAGSPIPLQVVSSSVCGRDYVE
jgi:hypothetical protein